MVLRPIVALSILFGMTVAATMDNEVYRGCGFDPVPGQPQALKFCTAYGLCIKTLCGLGRVFSRSHCGCVQAMFPKPLTPTPAPVTPRTAAVEGISDASVTHFPGAEAGVKDERGSADSFVPAASPQEMNTPSTMTALATPTWGTTDKEITDKRVVPSDMVAADSAKPESMEKRTSSQFSINRVSSKEGHIDMQTSKVVAIGVNTSSESQERFEAIAKHLAFSDTTQIRAAAENAGVHPDQQDLNLSRSDSQERPEIKTNTIRPNMQFPTKDAENHTGNTLPRETPKISQSVQNMPRTVDTNSIEITSTPPSGTGIAYAMSTSSTVSTVSASTITQRIMLFREKTDRDTTVKSMSTTTSPSELACGAEIGITGMSPDNVFLGNAVLGLDYIGNRGVTSRRGSAHFDGNGFIWIPFSDVNRLPTGITITMTFKENADLQMRQGLINNCGHDGASSISISLHPETRLIKFKAVVTSMNTPYSVQEVVEASIPYTPGTTKTLEMQSNGQSLIARVDSYVSGSHIPSSESYELLPGNKPLYVGRGCQEEETDNFHGDISNFALYRCVRT